LARNDDLEDLTKKQENYYRIFARQKGFKSSVENEKRRCGKLWGKMVKNVNILHEKYWKIMENGRKTEIFYTFLQYIFL